MQHRKDLSEHRFEQGINCINAAKILIDAGEYKSAANRSYYGVFHGMRAVLALDGVDFGKHAGVMSYFRKNYIKTQVFAVQLSRILTTLFEVRNESDYDDFYVISKEDVEAQFISAEFFLAEIRKFLDKA